MPQLIGNLGGIVRYLLNDQLANFSTIWVHQNNKFSKLNQIIPKILQH